MHRVGFGIAMIGLAGVACGGGMTPPTMEGREGMLSRTAIAQKCEEAAQQHDRPFVIEWDATDLAAFEAKAKNTTIVVRYEGCKLVPLYECTTAGNVGTFGAYGVPEFTSGTVQGFEVSNEGELYAKLPLGAASLSGRIEAGESLHLSYFVSGVATSSRDALYRADVDRHESCRDATHFVHSFALGAFELSTASHSGGAAEASGFGAEVGGSRRTSESQVGKGGDLASCKSQQQATCRVPIRLTLRSIRSGAPPVANAGAPPQPGEAPKEVRDQISNTQNVVGLWMEAVKKWNEKGDGAGCVSGMDEAARLDPKVRQNGAFQNVYWRCLMGAGRCDEGAKYLRDKLAAEDTARRKSDQELDEEVSEESNRICSSTQASNDADYVARASREISKASSAGDEKTCRSRFDGIASRYPKVKGTHKVRAGAERAMESAWRCVSKVSGCPAAKALFVRAEKLAHPNRADAELDKRFERDCR